MIVTFSLLAALFAIAVIDIRERRIPDHLSLPLIVAGLALAALHVGQGAGPQPLVDRIIGAAAGYLIFAVVGGAFFKLRGIEGLGLGDAKLLAATGAWLGWQMLPSVVLLASVGGLLQVAVQALILRRHDGSLAFGPWLAASFFALWWVTA